MTKTQVAALLPMISLGGSAVLMLLLISVKRMHGLITALTISGFCAALFMLFSIRPFLPIDVTGLIVMDGPAFIYTAIILGSGLVASAIGYGYLERQNEHKEEFYLLLLLASTGASVLSAASHFTSFFLGIELLSVSIYTMSAYITARPRSVEAGAKYLILAGMSSAFLLFGMASLYGETGVMGFADIAEALRGGPASPTILAGLVMIVVSVGFKLALVPFHLWAADVYEGAPAPAVAFIASVSKAGAFAVVFRFYSTAGFHSIEDVGVIFTSLAVASMFAGSLLALLQENVKRLLAYSSIAHMGYLLISLIARGDGAARAGAIYIAAYAVTSLGAFGVIASLSTERGDADRLGDFRGIAWSRPWTAAVFGAMMLSLAGLPLTAGFIGKFLIVASGVGKGLWTMVMSLVITSVISLFAYLRVVMEMFRTEEASFVNGIAPLDSYLLGILMLGLFMMGVYPAPIISAVDSLIALK